MCILESYYQSHTLDIAPADTCVPVRCQLSGVTHARKK